MRRPPRLAEWLLHLALPADQRDEVLGDLAEEAAIDLVDDFKQPWQEISKQPHRPAFKGLW